MLAFVPLPNGVRAAEPQGKELEKIQKKITKTSERARKFEQEADNLGQKINDLSQDLVQAAKKIQDAEDKIYVREDRLYLLNAQEKTHQKNLTARYDQMAKTLAAMQRLSQQPAELVTYRPEKAINSLRSASLLKVLQPELKKRAENIKKDMTELRSLRAEIAAERAELKTLLSGLTLEQIEMNQLLAERRQRQKELRRATREERKKLKQFAAKAKNLQDLIARIEQEAKIRAAKKAKAALAAAKRATDKPVKSGDKPRSKLARNRLDSVPAGSLSFAKARGHLPLPVRGSIGRIFGSKTPEGQSSEGITIHTLPRATVVAPHDGRIVFAGKFRSYGQLLIISHGPEYHTLLAGMTRLDAEVGQWVLKGEPVGQMATKDEITKTTTGGTVGQDLYVELRRMGKPINPLPWIAARDRKVL
ncbi:MAG: peptidoglycan DD-metalloendopeptidase family protein [Alphaproteobacteria bacterium]|nr:peptidoglycan DD-metalloendopeptidase family protein [Alphaproteobacteria bacterium]